MEYSTCGGREEWGVKGCEGEGRKEEDREWGRRGEVGEEDGEC